MIKIILTEDHQVVRDGIKSLIEKEEDMEVIGVAENGLEAMAIIESGRVPDILMTDVNMPEMNGLELSAKLSDDYPTIRKIILSMLDNETYVAEAFNFGINGYLLKNIGSEQMLFAIRHVAQGNKYICSELCEKMFPRMVRMLKQTAGTSLEGVELTPRELEVLTLTADGYTNNEIAEKLFTSRRTVEGHRQSLIDKTGVRNTAALVQFAFRSGLIS